jgi:ABC-type Fe3+-citrate transport system substrate-binding protein
MIIVDICLSDIPQGARITGSNGKVYTKIVVDKRKEKDKFENTHSVYINQTKEDREAKVNKTYVGNAKEIVFNGSTQQQAPASVIDKLGF